MAAGRASRFGGGKLDALCAGKPVGSRVVEAIAAAGLSPGICVTGLRAPRFLDGAQGWKRVINPDPNAGLGSSIALAARVASGEGAAALLIVLADMPLVPPYLLRALARSPAPAASDHGGGRPGVPALFPAALLDALERCEGDRGAAQILAQLPDCILLPADPGSLLDIDRPEDLARAEAALARSHPG